MTVQVLFFASLKEATGCDAVSVDLTEPADLAALIARLVELLGSQAGPALRAESVRVAVNQELISGARLINDGDEVAFLPPVTGG